MSEPDKKRYAIVQKSVAGSLETEQDRGFIDEQVRSCCLSKDITDKIDNIAKIIASWYFYDSRRGKNEFKKDIVAITSCMDIYVFASAIATEVYYFKRYWDENAKTPISLIVQGSEPSIKVFYNHQTTQALHSGAEKHQFYIEKRARQVITEVTQLLSDLEDKHAYKLAEMWAGWWDNLEDVGNPILTDNVNQLLQHLYFYVLSYNWLNKGGLSYSSAVPLEELAVGDVYKDCFTTVRHSDVQLFTNLNREPNISFRARQFKRELSRKIKSSEKLIEKVVNQLAERTASYTVEYSSVLLITIAEKEYRITNQLFRSIWDEWEETIEKTHLNIIRLTIDDEANQRYGVFFEGIDVEAFDVLIKFYKQFHLLACRSAYPTDAVLIPHLPPKVVFRHNLRRNVVKYANQFCNHFCALVNMQVISSKSVHQLKLLMTSYTTPDQASRYSEKIKASLPLFKQTEGEKSLDIDEMEDVVGYTTYRVEDSQQRINPLAAQIMYEKKRIGIGILFRENGKVFCVTCQHILDNFYTDFEEGKLQITMGDSHYIPVRQLNYKYVDKKTIRTARDEVLILEPVLDTIPLFDGSQYFNKSRLIQYNRGEQYSLTCYGLPVNYDFGHNIAISPRGYVEHDYIEGISDDDLAGGYSGAGIVDKLGNLFGIHAKHLTRNPKISLAIPAQTISDVLSLFYSGKETDTNGIC